MHKFGLQMYTLSDTTSLTPKFRNSTLDDNVFFTCKREADTAQQRYLLSARLIESNHISVTSSCPFGHVVSSDSLVATVCPHRSNGRSTMK